MQWTSIIAIYVLVWVATAFVMLPFGVRTHEELGLERVPGQADSAPANFQPRRLMLRATIVAAALTALFVANYTYGWIVAEDLNPFQGPPVVEGEPEPR